MNSLIIAANLTKRTIGNWKGMLLYIFMPALAVSLIIGLLGSGGQQAVAIYYVNADEGAAGAHMIRELSRNAKYELTEAGDADKLKQAVIGRKAAAAFVIPSGYTAALLAGKTDIPKIRHYELTMSEGSYSLRIALDQMTGRIRSSAELLTSAGAGGREAAFARMLEETEKHRITYTLTDYGWYENPALALATGIMILFIMALIGHSVAVIVEDRRQHTMMRMYAAPVRASEIALGNFLGSFLVGLLQIVIVLAFTRFALGFDYGLSFGSHLLVMLAFLFAVLGIASTIAGLVRHSENIGALQSMISTPMCMLGGCFWPVSIMPEFMQKVASFVPQSWVMDAVKRLATGQGISDLALHFVVLLLFGFVLGGFGAAVLGPASQESG
ncbi:ABC-2 type transport system permease protein [Paenibacillus sp. UNCCL117]|uniref:ABC transporter permease n=1 Tax=unclassified Paenibacillus TaxID=185978 RepID=UPI00088EEE05|nr:MULTISPECIES: ABC transporter permease [unclassified Paenibacillus]SDC78892.1 ABC-2 type transport system permease protein [Paenibacillus sp. cl123]SFW26168.1 ABC-2 type transport system permease protein [Paenibacillus sp. UNCCL117]